MKVLCVLGKHAYGDRLRGEGYEYVNFLPALRKLGHDVSVFESFARDRYLDFGHLNRALLQRVEETAADVLFCVLMQYEVWIETLRLIRRSGVVVVNWSTDDSWKYHMFSRLIGREFDMFVTTCPHLLENYRTDGIDAARVSQWAANSDALTPPIAADHCKYDVSFIGSAYGSRRAMVHSLQQAGIQVACFGYGWPLGPVEAKLIPEIIRSSRVSLNFSEASRGALNTFASRQIKARTFEVPGYGGCLLTQRTPHLEDYFRIGHELVEFEGEQELVNEVKSLLADPGRRDGIAQQGFERVRAEHTYDHRFQDLFKGLPAPSERHQYRPIDREAFETAARRHRVGPALKIVRSCLVFIASSIWGLKRGPRAARRMTFEVCWRLCGAWTYTAAGWPGRLFYRES